MSNAPRNTPINRLIPTTPVKFTRVFMILSIFTLGSFPNITISSESTIRHYQMDKVGTVSFSTPKSWKEHTYTKTKDAFPIIVHFESNTGGKFNVGFAISRPFAKTEPISKPKLKEMTQKAATRYQSRVEQKELVVEEFNSNTLSGYYFEASDKTPKLGEYKYMTYGYVRAYDFLVWFIVLSNDKGLATYEPAVDVLKTLKLSSRSSS